MKQILVVIIIGLTACSNPYINPDTSKALSEEKQLEEAQTHTELLKEQNVQLKRIADALEAKTKKTTNYDSLKYKP